MIRKYDLLTLLTPCIFSFVNLYMYIVYHGLCFTISWQKSHFLFVWTVHQKTIYLALIRQSLLRFQPEGLWSVCWTTQTIVGTLTFTVLVIFTSVQPYFLYKAPAHIHSLKRHPLILWCWSSKCVCGSVPRHIIFCLFTPLSIQVNRSAVTARTDSVHIYSWTYFYSLLSTTFVLSREVTF